MNIDHVATIAAEDTGLTIEEARDAAAEYIAQIEKLEGTIIDPDEIEKGEAEFLIEAIRAGHRAGDL